MESIKQKTTVKTVSSIALTTISFPDALYHVLIHFLNGGMNFFAVGKKSDEDYHEIDNKYAQKDIGKGVRVYENCLSKSSFTI